MEIYDESELTELELQRQRNIIKNHEFMKSCGLAVKPLVFVRRSKVDLEKLYEYSSSDESDEQDEEWVGVRAKKTKENKRFVPDFKTKVKNPTKYLENIRKKSSVAKQSSSTITKKKENIAKKVENKPIRIREILCKREDSTTINNEKKLERYPKRSERKNYREDDVPDDDHYIVCDECDEFYFGECSIHTPLIPFTDKTTSVDDKKSLATLPDGLEIKESLIPNAGLGVFATKKFDVGVRFGPYQGKKVRPDIPRDDIDTSYMWEIMKDGQVGYYVNGKDERHGNWMRFINCSRVEFEQNLVAFQFYREIYYRTYKPVEIGDELLVWYGDDYAKDLGIKLDDEMKSIQQPARSAINTNKSSVTGGEFECSRCSMKFQFDINYEYHLKYSKCHRNEIDNCVLKMKANDKVKPYACTVCKYKSSYSHHLKYHMRTHTNEKPFACTVCEFKCSRSSNLKEHMRTHTNEKPFACTVCEYKCSRSSDLKKHMRIHTNEKPFACTVCECKFYHSSNLKEHMRTHTNEKPFSCTVCEYKCSASSSLKDHMRTHSNERPFACTECEYKSSQSSNLRTHMRTHTNEKPYACTVCKYKSSYSHHLKYHMRTHTNEKPYACTVCEYKCKTSSNLSCHKKTHTKSC